MEVLHAIRPNAARMIGAAIGAKFLKDVKTDKLKKIFGAVLVLSGAVMLIL